ncbi:DMT family transporter [Vineibacter terrae]|uniref:DMT family transporter n=1 Tax=Vineibacter terrae TaxID=2586908 RepID=UPI002E2FC576|nr:DMT family transporter [Vineibacter terrae]HEX2886311.1 DMT family transporter [Vineibacter terrae]
MTSQQDETRIGILLAVASAVAFSTAGLFTRLITADAWTILFWRGLFAGLFIGGYVVWRHRARTLDAIRAIGWIGLVPVACTSLSTICFINALRLTDVADVMVIAATAPFVTAGLGWLWAGERESPMTMAASTVALAGVALMFDAGLSAGHLAGNLLAVAMAVLISIPKVVIRRRRETSMLPAASLGAFGCALAVLPAASPGVVSGMDLVHLILFGTAQFGLGLLLITIATRLISATRSALIESLDTPLAPLWVWLAFGEVPRLMAGLGGAVVMAAVTADMLLSSRRDRGRRCGGGSCRMSVASERARPSSCDDMIRRQPGAWSV